MKKSFNLTDADIKAIRTAEEIFASKEVRACVRDLFVLGLHLHIIGEKYAGDKACSLALRTLGISPSLKRRILTNIEGNEKSIYRAFQAHSEFNSLIENHSKP